MSLFKMVTLSEYLCLIVTYILRFFKSICFINQPSVRTQSQKKKSVRGITATRNRKKDGALILTPLVAKGKAEKAKKLSEVDPSLFAGVNSHSGYFTVDKIRKWNLFFWYFPAQGVDLENTPLVIWLQGGPGASSLYGLFGAIGPLQIVNGSVQKMPITWGSNYSLLFIDNPVGTGFSFTERGEYATNMDAVGLCLLSFIQQFLQVFPELRPAPLFLAGASYAGKYIPAFGHYIHNDKDYENPINFRGLMIGNGWIDPPTMLHYAKWALQAGLIDHQQAKDINKLESEARRNWRESNLSAYVANANDAMITLTAKAPVDRHNYTNGDCSKGVVSPLDGSIESFLNKPDVQKALHVNKEFLVINKTVFDWLIKLDEYLTVKPWLEELMEFHGVLCYNGQLDMLVPYAVSVHTYRSLQWSGRQGYLDGFRECLYDEENSSQVNSFVKSGLFFMEAMVVGAGHQMLADKPRAVKQLIDLFIKRYK